MHRSAPFVLGALVLGALIPSTAHAAAFQCDASALRLTVATTPAQEPITANRGAAACAPTENGGALPSTGGALFARTNLTGADPLSQVATASAGVGELGLALPVPALPVPDFAVLPGGGVIGVPGVGDVDLRPALAALDRPDRSAGVGEGPHRRGERELQGRLARAGGRVDDRRRSPCWARPSPPPTRSTAT